MSVHGATTYSPSAGFAFTRRWITQVTFGFNPTLSWTQTLGSFYFTDTSNPIVHVQANLNDSLFLTQSNHLTLDHVLIDWWLIIDPSPTPLPLNVSVTYQWRGTPARPEILIYPSSGFLTHFPFPIPASPSSYWLTDLP